MKPNMFQYTVYVLPPHLARNSRKWSQGIPEKLIIRKRFSSLNSKNFIAVGKLVIPGNHLPPRERKTYSLFASAQNKFGQTYEKTMT